MFIGGQQELGETIRIRELQLPRPSHWKAAVLGNGSDKGAPLSSNEH